MPTLESPQALIFDCDGTVAHTMPLHWRAWQSVTGRYGIDFPETRFYALGGVPGRNILKMLFAEQGIGGLDPLVIAKEKEAAYLEFLHEVRPVEPVVEIARRHRGVLPMAIATGGLDRASRRSCGIWASTIGSVPSSPAKMWCARNPPPIFFWRPHGNWGSIRPSAAPLKTPISEWNPSVQPEWKQSTFGSFPIIRS